MIDYTINCILWISLIKKLIQFIKPPTVLLSCHHGLERVFKKVDYTSLVP